MSANSSLRNLAVGHASTKRPRNGQDVHIAAFTLAHRFPIATMNLRGLNCLIVAIRYLGSTIHRKVAGMSNWSHCSKRLKPGPLGRSSLSDPVLPPEANQDDLHRQCVNSAPLMMGEALVFGHAQSPHIELPGRPYMAVRFAVPASAQRLLSMKCRAGW